MLMLRPSSRSWRMAGMHFGRGGNLDHDIGAIDGLPESASFVDGALRVVGEVGGDFETHITVAALGLRVD